MRHATCILLVSAYLINVNLTSRLFMTSAEVLFGIKVNLNTQYVCCLFSPTKKCFHCALSRQCFSSASNRWINNSPQKSDISSWYRCDMQYWNATIHRRSAEPITRQWNEIIERAHLHRSDMQLIIVASLQFVGGAVPTPLCNAPLQLASDG